ncbi:tandem-95 repeat protein [Vibrio parahaemolyticus]|nr:tandem-95 repeat protein [Vibrio parahaemolyticus]MEA5296248.1 tandem-95 repeat protein [Vibrio parahaemolyticus]
MDRTALVSLGNQVVVIGLDGKLRVLTEGQQPLPGEVVVTSTDVGPLDLNVQLTQEQGSKDVTDDVLQIISAIEQGQDPSAVDEEFAPAAGENGGSSLQTSATIVRDGTELLASTSFETIGIESLGLSQTQVLALNDLFRSNLQTSADSTDKPLATTPVTLDAIEEDGGSIIITTQELLSNVDDEDKDTLSVENLIIDKGNGTLVDNGDGTWTFTPQIDDDTEVSFTFDIIDDEDLVVSGSANLDILPINDAPNAENDVITTEEDTAVTIDVLVNDSDVEGDALSIQSASVPSEQGSVDIVDGKLVFTPAENFNGEATITYIVTDGDLTDEAKVTVTVTPVNDSPVAVDDTTSIQEDTAVTIDVLTNDTDVDGDKLSIESASVPKEQGTVEVVDGKLVFTPAENFNGDAEITYTVTDGELTDEAKVTVTVNPVNDAPTIKVEAVESITEDAVSTDTVVATLTVRDTDTPEDQLTVSLENNSNGYFVLVGNEVKLTQAGVDAVNNDELNLKGLTISASVSDGVNPTASDSDSLIVNRVNDAPTIKVDAVESITEDAVSTDTVVATLTVRDTDTPEDQLTVSLENNSNGYFVLVGNEVKLTQAGVDAVNNDELNLKDLTISASVSDGVNPTANDSDSLSVNRVNDAPVAKDDIATTQEDTAVTIDVLPNDSDVDGDKLSIQSASVPEAQGKVEIVDGKLVFTPAENFHGDAEITYTLTEGALTDQATVNVTVNAVNDTPVVESNLADQTLAEDFTPYTIDLNTAFSDVDNVDGELTFSVSGNSNVLVSIENGIATISPTADWNGSETLTFTATDPSGESVSQTVDFTVAPVVDIKADSTNVVEDTPTIINVLGNDTFEGDGKVVSLDANNGPVNGSVSVNPDGSVTYTPNDNYHGIDSFTYIVTSGGVSESTTVNVDVTPENDAPVAKDDTAITDEDTPVTIDVLPNDTDVDGDKLSIESASVPKEQGTVEVVNGKLVFTPTENFNGDAEITYTVTDGALTDQATVKVTVNAVNDTPVVESNIADQALAEDFTPYTIDLNTAFSDVDNVDGELTFSVSGNSNIQVAIVNGIATITPTADWNGSETLTFTATDPSGESISQTVNFTVAPVADIVADKATVVEDTSTVIKVLGNDTFEGDGKVVSLDTNNGPANGTVSVNPDGSVTYTPNDNYHGTDSFTYIVTSGGVSESTTVSVDVTPVNDAPVATNDTAITDEDTPVTIDVLPNDTDVDGDKLSIQSASVPEAQGKVEIVDGKLVFTPAENFNGHAEIIYTVTDGELTDEAKVTVTVNPVNDAPTIKVDAVESITEDAVNTDTVVATLTVRDTDTPEDQLTVSLENNSNGYFVLVGNEVKLTQAGVDAVNNDELNLKDLTISASVSDGVNPTASDSDSLVVNRVNDAPTVENAIADQVLSEDFDAYTIDLNEVFKDSDSSLVFSVSGNSNIQVAIVNGIATFTPTADWNGSEALTFTATDPSGESVSQTVNFTVAPVVDIVADKATVVEDTPTIIKVLGNDTFEGDDKVVSLDTNNGPANGTVSVNPDGSVTYTPNDNYHGTDSFTYIVTSGGVSESTTVSVDVTPVNDAPVAKDDTAITDEDTPVTIDVLPNDTDIDGDKLSIQSASVPETQGKVEIVDGKLVFTPAENFHGDAEITYTITDGALTDQATVNVTVNAVNDTPVVESSIADQTLAEDFTPYTIDLNTAFSDVDNVDGELTFSVSGNSNIQVAIVNGIATFTPTADWNGSETLTFTATDPSGESISQTVNFTVAPVADIVADKATVVEDTSTVIKVLGNDTFEGDGKVVSLDTNNGPANGTVSVNPDGSVTYTPNDNYHGADSFTYIVTSGGVSESTTVNVDVTPVNDAPVAKDDIATTQEDTAVTIDVLPNDSDVDGDKLSIQSASVPEAQGKVEIVDGKLVFTPAENFHGDAEITYTVTDGALTDQATVNVTVNAVNDTPVVESNLADQTLAEDFTTYTIDLNTAFSDVDNVDGELTFSVSGNSNVLVSIENGIATISPTADWNGSETLTFTATDPSGESVSQTVDFTVAPVVDIEADSADVVEDTPTIINVLGNDTFEGKDKVVSLDAENGPKNGTVIVNNDGTVTYTPDDNYVGKDTFTYVVTSGGVSESTTVEVNVTPVNDAPVAKDDIATTQEDTAVTIDVLPNDTDADGDKLSIESASVPKEQGTVEVVDGKLVFTPAENFNGDAEITYTVTDGALTDQAKVTVTVNPVNDAPTIKVDAVESITEDAVSTDTVVATLTVRDTDTPEDQLTVSLENNSNGYFVLVGDEVKLTQAGVDAVNNDELNLKDLTISASVSDGVNPTANDSDSLVVNRVNDAPTVENAIADQVLSEDFDAYTIDLNEVFKDSDSSLEFSVSGNNSIQISIVNGVATITPTADWNGKETITFTAKDPSGESVNQTVDFTVAPVVDIEADSADVVEDTPTIINVLGNDTFESTDKVVSLDAENGPKNGTVIVNNDGTVTYTPDDNYVGEDTFTYIVTSGGVSESTTVSVDVTPVNDAPVAKDDTAITDEDTPVTIDVLPNDNDIDGDKLSIQSASVPEAQGKVEIVDGKLVFTPAENFNGHAEITYTVTDGQLTDEAKVTVTVNPVNDAPTIKVDAVESITEDAVSTDTVVATLTVRDTDTSEDQLTVSLENNSNGYFVLVGDEVKLTQAGVDAVNNDELNLKGLTISASVSDGVNPTASDSDSLIVNRVNDAPTIKVDAVESITEDAVSTDTVVATLTVRDTDTPEDQLTVSLENNSNGYFVLVGNEVKLTQAGVDAVNNDELNLKDLTISASVSDGLNPTANDSDSLIVNRVNEAPTVENAIADQELSEDFATYTIDLNDAFKDSDSALNFSVSGNSNVLVSIENGIATISPTADWNGSETLMFTATDPSGESVSQTVNFTVAPVADIVADKATVVEDTSTIIKVLGNDTFESTDKVVSLDAENGPKNGTVIVNNDGTVTYTPDDNYVGEDTFTYIVTSGGVSESTTVSVDVTPENDAPVAKDDTAITDEDTPVTIDVLPNDTDVDGDKLSIESASVPKEQGTVEVVNGKLVFTPAENFNGDAEITYTVTDGALTDQATVKVTVNAVNDTPVVESNVADQTLAEDFTPYTIDLNTVFSDVDNVDGELKFSVSGNSNIQVAIVNGIATITPTADWNGSETLTFTATDPSGESVSQTVDFTVTPVADIVADKATVVEDTPTIIKVLGNDTFEGDNKVVSLDAENGPKNGTVIVNNDGTVTYTPNDNYVGKDTFTYIVTSGGVSESTTVEVNVTPVNDKPESEDFTHVADDQLTQVVFDTDTKPLGSGDSKDHIADVEDDLKGNDLHVRITELPTSGTLFFKDSDGELHEIKEVSDTLYDKDSLYYEADNVGFLLGIKDRPNTPNGSESTSDFNNWGLSEDGGPSHSRIEHLANGASITISSDSGELAQYNRQVSHIGNGIADNDGQGIEKGETITVDLSNNPVGSVNLGLDGLGGLFDYGDDNAALITVTYLDSNNVQQTQTFEFLKPEGNFMLFQETSVGYGKDLALPEGSVITQLDFSTKNEGNWELRYVEGVPAEDSFGYVAVDSESGVSDPSTVNIVNEMLDGNVTENGPAVQSITGVTVVEGDNVTFSVSLNNATDQTVKYQVDFSAEGSSTSSQDIDLSNATFTNGVKYLGGYLIVPAGVNGFDITIPSIDDQLVESTESLVIKVGDVSGVGYIDDNDVPPTVQSNEISGLEDEAIVITLEHLGVVDSGVSVEFDTSALNGSLQVKGSDGWEAVSGSVLASDIENGLVRYVPAEHESGANVFDKDGVGNGLDTYEQIHFTVSDGNSSASGTLSIDIEPVADPIKIDLTFGPVTSVPVTLGGSWSTDEELKDLLEASNLPGLDFEHVVTQAFNNGHVGNDLMLSGDTESPLSFVGDQQAGANVDAQGSDIFVTGGGNDSIYGGIGSLDDQAETDTVVYSGKLSDYDFSYYPASDHSEVPYWIVEDSRFIDTKDVVSSTHKESGDHLYEIEQLIFQDAIIKLDNNTGEYVVLTEQQVSFELNLDLIDVDGSESFINDSVTLTGIPSGLTLEVNGKTVTENSDGSYTVDLSSEPNQTSHQLSGTITVPADYNGSLDFDVTATAGSVEVNNNTQMGADTASVSVRDYEFVSGTHGDNNIVGSDDNDVIVGDVQGLQIVEGQDYNIAFMLDTSGSMGYDVGRAVTELKTVLNTLIESASGPHSGKVNVLLTTFSTESKQVLELDLSSDNAKSQVESILDAIVKRGDGNTNYEAGFQSALNWFDSADSGATNLSYFISDGRPNQATVNDANNINQMDSIVLGVENNKLVTLADVLPADYKTGDVVTYDNKTVIDSNSLVYSLSTGELLGKMTSNHSYYDYETYVLHQANNAYQALEELSEVRSIGLGHDLDEDSLKHFDSDGVVRTNIDVNQLAEVILGKEVSLMQGKDEISSLDGNDIIFGDAIRFDINGEQGVSALQNYVASQLGKDVALVTKEEVHHYITENQAEFEQSRYYDQADTIYGGAGNDILFGQGGNDKLFGGADNDILIGGLGSDILTGGDGEDIFKWIDVANERDTVTDFSSSEDSLDFSDLFDDLSKDEVGDLLSDLQSGSHTGDAGGYHVEVSQDGSADTNLSITKGSSTLDIHFNSASVDDITQHLIASLDSQYKDM